MSLQYNRKSEEKIYVIGWEGLGWFLSRKTAMHLSILSKSSNAEKFMGGNKSKKAELQHRALVWCILWWQDKKKKNIELRANLQVQLFFFSLWPCLYNFCLCNESTRKIKHIFSRRESLTHLSRMSALLKHLDIIFICKAMGFLFVADWWKTVQSGL